MSTGERNLFNFLPLTDLQNGSTQQVNDYFKQIDDSLRFVLECALSGATDVDVPGTETVQTQFLSGQAGLSALRVVAVEPSTGAIRDGNSALLTDACDVIGISINAGANIGDPVNVVTQGFITDSSFAFNTAIDPTLFLNGAGVISQTRPTTGFNLQVGQVISSDTMLVQLSQPITLA